ncbi:MAG: SCO family protein [Gammaproteobacteria bacterium]|nr:MAG: SCO family protein [Gammaproteobacteria bacterium]
MRAAVATLAVSLAIVFSLGWASNGFTALTSQKARQLAVATEPRDVPDVELVMANGERRMLHEILSGRRGSTVVGFFYAGCQTICLTLANDFTQLQGSLTDRSDDLEVNLLSISFAPETDSPTVLQAYAKRMAAQVGIWDIAVIRHTKDLPDLYRSFGLRVIGDGKGGYVHNSAFHILSPEGKLVGIVDLARPQAALKLATSAAML